MKVNAFRWFLLRLLKSKAPQFHQRRPNARTRRAIKAADQGRMRIVEYSPTLVNDILRKHKRMWKRWGK